MTRPTMPSRAWFLILVIGLVAASSCASDDTLTVYSGRSEELIGPLIEAFAEETGIRVAVRYGDSPELSATLLEEGANSPADVFFAQDPGSIGAVALAGLLDPLPPDVLELVPPRFRDRDGLWVGTSGRVRVLAYNTARVASGDLPNEVAELLDERWRGRVAVAPTNGSFVTFVASMILATGEEATVRWLAALADNDPADYASNSAIVAAIDAGEVDVGLTNHYYVLRLIAEQGDARAANHFLRAGDPGSLVMPASIGVVAGSDRVAEGRRLIEFMLSQSSQRYFAEETFEYPLVAGVPPAAGLPPLDRFAGPEVELSELARVLDRATTLIAEAGLL